jgi:2-keto-4-pentenoate hydratase
MSTTFVENSEVDMLDRSRSEAVQLLLGAYESGNPVAPLSTTFPDIDLEDAYAIQLEQIEDWKRHGRRVIGHKVGLTSLAVQKQLGVSQPDFGHLMDDMFYLSGEPIPAAAFMQPRVEPEIAFVLKKPLRGPGVTVAEAIAAVDFVLAALEIVDSRIANWQIQLTDTVADNASSGGVVLGTKPVRLDEIDLRLLGAVLYKNGRIQHSGAGAAVLGSPISSLVWLANTLGRLGTTLEAGEVVIPGAITPLVPASPGDTVTATFAALGSVTATFASADHS